MLRMFSIILLISGIMVNCGDETGSVRSTITSTAKNHFISATIKKEIQLDMLKTLAQMADRNEFAKLVKYGVKSYRLTYETRFDDHTIIASGLVYIPEGLDNKAPIISLQHGTTFVKRDAPSTTESFSGMEYFASAGYIAIMPDYIGYGESSEIFHPYYDRKSSALAVIDMIKATKEFLTKEHISFNDQLFLAGYSEGGYVTLAAAKELETNPIQGLKITAVAAGAGGYDLEEMLRSITSKTYYAYPSYLAFVLMSYYKTYSWDKPLTRFFQPKYAEALNKYMNGKNDGWYLNSQLTTNVTSLLDDEFYNHIKSGNEPVLMEALKTNSVGGWETSIPMRLYHGTNDEIIPFNNSEITLKKFKEAGSKDVELKSIPQGSHGSSFVPMLENFVPWFETLRK